MGNNPLIWKTSKSLPRWSLKVTFWQYIQPWPVFPNFQYCKLLWLSNWRAWCKTNVSDFFGWNCFFFKSDWIFAWHTIQLCFSISPEKVPYDSLAPNHSIVNSENVSHSGYCITFNIVLWLNNYKYRKCFLFLKQGISVVT